MISLARTFTTRSLLKFAAPSMLMMLFLSTYSIVDGVFVARLVGTTALSAINIFLPLFSLEMALGIMVSSGGSAIIARLMGEGDPQRACSTLSFLVCVEVGLGVVIGSIGLLACEPIMLMLGSNAEQLPYCVGYGRILMIGAPLFFLQISFQTFFTTAGKPSMGLAAMIGAGITNIALDYLFIAVMGMGIEGSALATAIGWTIPSITGLVFFTTQREHPLHFSRPDVNWPMLLEACGNGSSEMVGNIAEGITTFLFNMQAMRLFGTDGVAAVTIVLYFEFILTAMFFGYTSGIAPVVSYKLGARDTAQLRQVFRSGLSTIAALGVISFVAAQLSDTAIIEVFAPSGSHVNQISVAGFPLYSFAFLLMGFSLFTSSLFTALGDGRTSATVAFSRSFLLIGGALLVMPFIWGEMGLWLAVPVAEVLSLTVSVTMLVRGRARYHYA